MNTIRKSVAILLCSKIRQENKLRWFTISGLTCRLCMRSSQGDPLKMRMYKNKKYNNCRLVNDWYSKLSGDKIREKFENIGK
ncbi:MAG: hypothetical protein JW712_11510 [Dehalococcoidales bacterium]|nr:hypothetical protein [Dehalococcoidales bacterium]